jgi:uncharacterized membrane protein YecN with MAPEG domain
MNVPVVALYGSLNALFNILLASRVSSLRRTERVSVGHGESKRLEVAARIHGNNAEFVPLGIVMLLIAELMGGSSLWLHVFGGSLFVGRVLHAIGMPRPAPNFGRFVGTALTWTTISLVSGWILYLRFSA